MTRCASAAAAENPAACATGAAPSGETGSAAEAVRHSASVAVRQPATSRTLIAPPESVNPGDRTESMREVFTDEVTAPLRTSRLDAVLAGSDSCTAGAVRPPRRGLVVSPADRGWPGRASSRELAPVAGCSTACTDSGPARGRAPAPASQAVGVQAQRPMKRRLRPRRSSRRARCARRRAGAIGDGGAGVATGSTSTRRPSTTPRSRWAAGGTHGASPATPPRALQSRPSRALRAEMERRAPRQPTCVAAALRAQPTARGDSGLVVARRRKRHFARRRGTDR